jgi:hypothetical protein
MMAPVAEIGIRMASTADTQKRPFSPMRFQPIRLVRHGKAVAATAEAFFVQMARIARRGIRFPVNKPPVTLLVRDRSELKPSRVA